MLLQQHFYDHAVFKLFKIQQFSFKIEKMQMQFHNKSDHFAIGWTSTRQVSTVGTVELISSAVFRSISTWSVYSSESIELFKFLTHFSSITNENPLESFNLISSAHNKTQTQEKSFPNFLREYYVRTL